MNITLRLLRQCPIFIFYPSFKSPLLLKDFIRLKARIKMNEYMVNDGMLWSHETDIISVNKTSGSR